MIDLTIRKVVRYIVAATLVLALVSCATPVAPSGGPVDSTPPAILSTNPEGNTVRFDGETFVFEFSERVDARSFQQALSITPEPTVPPDISSKKSRVTVRFQEPLRDSTTYILSLDNNLKDLHNVALESPLTVAVATGDVIDKGQIAGELRSPLDNRPVSSIDIYAYLIADTTAIEVSSRTPDFRTQTGKDGRFLLSYLPERPFFIAAVQDNNRNRLLDAGEGFAAPAITAVLAEELDSTRVKSGGISLHFTQTDLTLPAVQRARSLSSSRLQLRYDEPLSAFDLNSDHWIVQDSLTSQRKSVHSVYAPPAEPRLVELLLDSLSTDVHRIITAAVSDTAGNASMPDTLYLTPGARVDTTVARFVAFLPSPAFELSDSLQLLLPGTVPGIRFSSAPDVTLLRQRLGVTTLADQAIEFSLTTENGVDYSLLTGDSNDLNSGVLVTFQPLAIDTTYQRFFRTISGDDLGEISGVLADAPETVVVELFAGARSAAARRYAAVVDATGVFVAPGLPAGPYFLRIFVDTDRNGAWSGGNLTPYIPPEPLVWHADSLVVRPRWTTTPSDTLTMPPDTN